MVIRMAEQPGGPGQFARRTDRQPVRQVTDAAYGEQKTFREQQQAAPMVDTSQPAQAGAGMVDVAANVTPFGAPSERPDEPITAGAPFGAGPGPEALGLPSRNDEAKALLKYLPMLERRASSPDASPTFQNIVQYLKGLQG